MKDFTTRPVIIGKKGVEKILELKLNSVEKKHFSNNWWQRYWGLNLSLTIIKIFTQNL